MKKKITLVNVISSLLMQITSIISALIVPRLILETFGSNANGLVSSILQFLNYIALVEGGITGVIAANLYQPLVTGDNTKLSSIIATAKSFYQKIGFIFIAYSVVVGLFYPVIVETGYSNIYVLLLTLVLSIGLMMEYMFSLTYTTLLNADKKVYYVSITTSILTVFNILLTIIVVKLFHDIILLKLANAVLFSLRPLIYGMYIKKHYDIDWRATKENELIKQRWNGFAINLAYFIHVSTDVTLLTLFADLKTVSVYSVYFLIVSKICVMLNAVTSGVEPAIGQAYAKNDEYQLNQKMDLYEFIILFTVSGLFTLTGLLITPFVMMYTNGITDANYYQPVFGAFLVIAEAAYLLRAPHVSLAYSANKFKEITLPAYIEAVINIIISIVLIKKIGLVGIAIGTLAGMLYRGAFHVYFTSKLVPARSQWKFYRKLMIIIITSVLTVAICVSLFPISTFSFYSWIVHAIIYAVICLVLLVITCLGFFRKELDSLKTYMRK